MGLALSYAWYRSQRKTAELTDYDILTAVYATRRFKFERRDMM